MSFTSFSNYLFKSFLKNYCLDKPTLNSNNEEILGNMRKQDPGLISWNPPIVHGPHSKPTYCDLT